MIGLWAGISGIGLAAGPVAGGVLADAFGWPAIFLINLPIGVVLLLAGLRVLGESRNPGAPPSTSREQSCPSCGWGR